MYEQEEHATERIKEIEAEEKKLKEEQSKTGRHPVKPKKKAVVINILSRLKSLDFLLLGRCHMEHEGTCAEAIAEESSEETKRKFKKRKKKSEVQLKNIQSRVEISNFLLRKVNLTDEDKKRIVEEMERQEREEKTIPRPKNMKEIREEEKRMKRLHDAEAKKKSFFMRVKDGEFGGMNTGEVEWTEPRDTANSRKKRDKDVA